MSFPPGPLQGAPIGGTQFFGSSPSFSGFLRAVPPPLTGVDAAIPINVEDEPFSTQLYAHAPNSAVVTINLAGRYRVEYVGSAQNGNASASASRWTLASNVGAGFVVIPGTLGFGFHLNVAVGFNTCSSFVQRVFAAGEQVRLQASRLSGLGILTPTAGGCRLGITRLSA